MIEHIETVRMIAEGTTAAADFSTGGKLLGSVGTGGLALGLTAVLVGGIREPKNGKVRRKLTSTQASVIGVAAGTLYMSAGSIWTAGGSLSDALAQVFTSGAFGTAGLGAVSAVVAAWMYFREMKPGAAAVTAVLAAGVWAQAGGIWGLPQALVLTTAGAVQAI